MICPGGASDLPYGGARNHPSVSWVPNGSSYNTWVQVGEENACVPYENFHPETHPSWGITGEDNELITRHILCCNMNLDASAESQNVESANSASTSQENVMEKYQPKWFGRNDGWDGKTYFDGEYANDATSSNSTV